MTLAAPVFIGDEVTAAGFRLTGVRALVPEPSELVAVFERARAETELILLTAETAQRLPDAPLRHALAASQPLVVVIPDARETVPVPDLEERLRRILGVAE